MSSLLHWFQKRRSLSEETTKDKMLGFQITVTKKGRGNHGAREVTMKKQKSLPARPNYPQFYLDSDNYDTLYDHQENMYNQYARLYGNRDSMYDIHNPDFIMGYQPIWNCQRNVSEQLNLNHPCFYNAKKLHPLQFSNKVPATSGLVLRNSFSQQRHLGEMKARRRSDSLFNYVPKAFGDQDASKILNGERKDDVLTSRMSLPALSATHERRSGPGSTKLTSNCVTINLSSRKNDNSKRFARTCSLDRPTFPDVDEESLDLNENDGVSHFFFTPAMLIEDKMEDKENQEAFNNNKDVTDNDKDVTDNDKDVKDNDTDVTDNDNYNINSKSADEEVSNILKEFENIDRDNSRISDCSKNIVARQEFLY
ncbi:uncharacterized protein LOC106069548 [Biomphalaria glabrata]|uniref:Uncharacterized protein LOC106069548 n=1 Tax=Biomphalaria glabrata TaxID=6526 RepID=A0A9U8EF82_BIOGL|nr:uncharacterized protein LOC106069548 [Biomphalaria glabrata]XP_013084702.2 uncharacterized protein LOC106069548 [Biomphalaria glabrata]